MFFSKLVALLAATALVAHALPQSEPNTPAKRAFSAFSPVARSLHSSRTLSPSMAAVLEVRDEPAARCALKRDCPDETSLLVDRFFEIATEAIAARVCDGCCGDNCTCLRR
ncbi:hypothetical protein K438DRAFT_1821667 [Mycena galopus ATCC 62051]|nr:hypothetical protein K438DRAFT_1821667 [Mycena galopus ATCC 62051]